jgi:hypothetical protein
MGINTSKDCGCISVVSRVALSLWHPQKEEPHLSFLEEDELVPANLLSEQEIQCLLSESSQKYETV